MNVNFGQNLYKVTKVKVKNQDSRMVTINDSFVGQAEIAGQRLMVGNVNYGDGLVTSAIEILTLDKSGNWLVETRNSVYTMERLND
jgi:hypothetical protein